LAFKGGLEKVKVQCAGVTKIGCTLLFTRGEGNRKCQAKKTRESIARVYLDFQATKSLISNRYHWALIVGPKNETENGTGTHYHAKERPKPSVGSEFYYDEQECSLIAIDMLLVRIMIGKVENGPRLVEFLRDTPIRQYIPGWNCVSWVQEILETLEADKKALGTSVLEWDQVRDEAMRYCQQKKDEHRFDRQGTVHSRKPPSYDWIEKREIIA
jgi:hypothetical protein